MKMMKKRGIVFCLLVIPLVFASSLWVIGMMVALCAFILGKITSTSSLLHVAKNVTVLFTIGGVFVWLCLFIGVLGIALVYALLGGRTRQDEPQPAVRCSVKTIDKVFAYGMSILLGFFALLVIVQISMTWGYSVGPLVRPVVKIEQGKESYYLEDTPRSGRPNLARLIPISKREYRRLLPVVSCQVVCAYAGIICTALFILAKIAETVRKRFQNRG